MKHSLLILLLFSIGFTQDIGNIFTKETSDSENKSISQIQDLNLTNIQNLTYTPVGNTIDPETYLLGPGDLLGINILATNNVSMSIRVNPVGEILIPSIGVLNVNGVSLNAAKNQISDYVINNVLRNAIVDVTLIDIRRFKVQILGAVHKPGFIYLTPLDGVYEALELSGGVQKFAHPEIINIKRDGQTLEVRLTDYLSGKDASQNISLKEGDKIFVPYSDYATSLGLNSNNYLDNHIVVFGFVNSRSGSNTFKYFPGYTVRDYIALAGGTKEQGASFRSGNIKKSIIYRVDGKKIKNALNEFVLPGDMIEVPPSLFYQIVGGDGVIRTLASIASSAYIVYRFSKDK